MKGSAPKTPTLGAHRVPVRSSPNERCSTGQAVVTVRTSISPSATRTTAAKPASSAWKSGSAERLSRPRGRFSGASAAIAGLVAWVVTPLALLGRDDDRVGRLLRRALEILRQRRVVEGGRLLL